MTDILPHFYCCSLSNKHLFTIKKTENNNSNSLGNEYASALDILLDIFIFHTLDSLYNTTI